MHQETKKTLPKLSYVLLSHNRKQYIRAAIESAFAQDYEGELEYIFSDDCSTDGTYEIVKECADSYKGTRRVVVTQTPTNLHLAEHTNYAVQFATGDYIVRADDDDISTVDRCSIIGNLIARYPECTCVQTKCRHFHDFEEEDIIKLSRNPKNKNQTINIYDITKGYDGITGFSSDSACNKVWAKAVYSKFSPLPRDGYYVDDLICLYRANVLGYYVQTTAITVMARQESGNMSSGENYGGRSYASIMRLEQFNDKYANVTYEPLSTAVDEVESYMRRHRAVDYDAASLFFETLKKDMQRRAILRSYWRKGLFNRLYIRKHFSNHGLFSLVRCLPMPIFARLLSWYRVCADIFFRKQKQRLHKSKK